MGFGDIASRFKKKQEDTAPAPVERDYVEVHALRSRIVGVLIRDARLANGVSQVELAEALHVTEDQVRDWEFGNESPSLPQLEMLAYFLGIPVSHFWSDKTISGEQTERKLPEAQYTELRDR